MGSLQQRLSFCRARRFDLLAEAEDLDLEPAGSAPPALHGKCFHRSGDPGPDQEMVASNPPADAELQSWMSQHPDSFRTEPRVAFLQVV